MPLTLEQAIIKGRHDPVFWCEYFLEQCPHEGQAEFLENAEAQENIGATANRWGKTALINFRHWHRCFYKIGGEFRYTDENGVVDPHAYLELPYQTLHAADGWETVRLVWELALRYADRPKLRPFIKATPRSLPPHIEFQNGAKWYFRTLGENGKGIDGNSFYLISIDEAGWVKDLKWTLDNVVRLRTADVRGVVDLMGTFKPGVSRDFFGEAKKAAVYMGKDIALDYQEWMERRRIEQAKTVVA